MPCYAWNRNCWKYLYFFVSCRYHFNACQAWVKKVLEKHESQTTDNWGNAGSMMARLLYKLQEIESRIAPVIY